MKPINQRLDRLWPGAILRVRANADGPGIFALQAFAGARPISDQFLFRPSCFDHALVGIFWDLYFRKNPDARYVPNRKTLPF